jgi:hypothetical protein
MDDLRALMDTMFFGAVALTQAVLPHMRQQQSGAIVQISSQGGQVAFAGVGAFCAAKFALEGLSEALASEVAPPPPSSPRSTPRSRRCGPRSAPTPSTPSAPSTSGCAPIWTAGNQYPATPRSADALPPRRASASRLPTNPNPRSSSSVPRPASVTDRHGRAIGAQRRSARATVPGRSVARDLVPTQSSRVAYVPKLALARRSDHGHRGRHSMGVESERSVRVWRADFAVGCVCMHGTTTGYAVDPVGEYIVGVMVAGAMRARRGRERFVFGPRDVCA